MNSQNINSFFRNNLINDPIVPKNQLPDGIILNFRDYSSQKGLCSKKPGSFPYTFYLNCRIFEGIL